MSTWKSLNSQRPHMITPLHLSPREDSKRDIDGASPSSVSLRPGREGPNPNFQTSYLPLSRSSILSSYMSSLQIIPPSPPAVLCSPSPPVLSPRLIPTEISSFLLRRIICTDFPQTTTSIAFFFVSLARPALPLLSR